MTNELLQVCEKLRDDLLMRAEIDSDGTRVVNVSATIWSMFNEVMDNTNTIQQLHNEGE
jgi:hypothetical protein